MATLEMNVNQVNSDFQSIKTAITDKGVAIDDGTKTSEYAGKIDDVYDTGYEDGTTVFRSHMHDRLGNFIFPSNCTKIKLYAFAYTWGLSSIVIHKNVNYLANSVFDNAANLTSVIFEEGGELTTWGTNEFRGCAKLHTVKFGCVCNKYNFLESSVFTGCTKLKIITVAQDELAYNVYLHQSDVLDKTCVYNIIRKLKNHTGLDTENTYTFKISSTVWANIEDTTAEDYEAPPNGDTWEDYVVNLGYNI